MSEAIDLEFAFVKGAVREGRQCVRLLKDFAWNGIVVPAGFISDFASVPEALDGVVSSFGPYAPATTIHDWLYATGGLFGYLTRAECDGIFRDYMAELGVPLWKRTLMWAAVRAGGASGFGRIG